MEERVGVRTKDMPVVSTSSAITVDDRIMFVYRVKNTEDRASYSIKYEAFRRGVLQTFKDDGSVNDRFYGSADPSPSLGTDGDLYFQYFETDGTKNIGAMYVKYDGSWQNI